MCNRVCNMAFDFITTKPVLENPPLKLVLCQMRFPHRVGLSDSELRPVQKAVEADYPDTEIGNLAGLTLGPTGMSAGEPERIFHFRSHGGAWTVTVTANSLSLETNAYVDFKDFLERWHNVATVVCGALDVSRQDRIGLRYVDELPCPPNPGKSDLEKILIPALVGPVGANEHVESLVASMNELRFAQSPGACTLRHGLVQKADESFAYILDIDSYDESSADVNLEDQAKRLAVFNERAYSLFEWAVEPDFFKTFGEGVEETK